MTDDNPDEAFRSFVMVHQHRLVRVAYALCGDRDRAEDFAQDALLGLYRAWARLDGPPDAYVYRSIANARASWWQRRGRHETTSLVPDRAGLDESGASEDRVVLVQALTALPRRQRQVVVLRFVADLGVDETAAALGISAGTVKSQTHKGLAALRAHPALSTLAPVNGEPA